MDTEELKRYQRQIILPDFGVEGQEKLKNAKVLVIGTGGLGSPVLLYLTAAGVGNIGIVDFDVVDETNLQRQILFTTAEVGKLKTDVALQKLSALNPFTKFKIYKEKLVIENAENIIKHYDIVVDCPDNFETRYLVSDVCKKLNKPHIYGAISTFSGQVSVFNFKGSSTYRDLFPEEPGKSEIKALSPIPVIGVLPGIIGTMQANETIKVITGVGTPLNGKLLMLDISTYEMTILDI